MCASVLCRIFNELYKDNMPICKNQKLYDAVTFMEQNYFDCNLSPAHAAEHVFMSDSYFRKLFKEYSGMTPNTYLLKSKIKKAKSYLRYDNLSIADIANLLGFSDSAYFIKRFREETGITPDKYRKNM